MIHLPCQNSVAGVSSVVSLRGAKSSGDIVHEIRFRSPLLADEDRNQPQENAELKDETGEDGRSIVSYCLQRSGWWEARSGTDTASLRAYYYIFVWPGDVCVKHSVVERVPPSSSEYGESFHAAESSVAPGGEFCLLVHLYDDFRNRIAQGGELLHVTVQGIPISGKVQDFANGIYKISCKLGYDASASRATQLETHCRKEGVMTVYHSERDREDMWAELTEEHIFSIFKIRNGERCLPAAISVNMSTVRVKRHEGRQPNDPNINTHFELEHTAAGADGAEATQTLHLCCRRLEETLRWIAILRRVSTELVPLPAPVDDLGSGSKIESAEPVLTVAVSVRGEEVPGSPFSIAIVQQQESSRDSNRPILSVPIGAELEPESTTFSLQPVQPLEQWQANDHSALALHHRLAQQVMQAATTDHELAEPFSEHEHSDDEKGRTVLENGNSTLIEVDELTLGSDESSSTNPQRATESKSSSPRRVAGLDEYNDLDEVENADDVHLAEGPSPDVAFDDTTQFSTPKARSTAELNTALAGMTMTYPGRMTPAQRRRQRLRQAQRGDRRDRTTKPRGQTGSSLMERPSFRITKFKGLSSLESVASEAIHSDAAKRARSRSPDWRKDRIPPRRTRSKSPVLTRRERQMQRYMETNDSGRVRSVRKVKASPEATAPQESSVDGVAYQVDAVERLRMGKRLAKEGLISQAVYEDIKEAIIQQLKHGLISSPLSTPPISQAHSAITPADETDNAVETDTLEGGEGDSTAQGANELTQRVTSPRSTAEKMEDGSDNYTGRSNSADDSPGPSHAPHRFNGGYNSRIRLKTRDYDHTPLSHASPFKSSSRRTTIFGGSWAREHDVVKDRIMTAKRKPNAKKGNFDADSSREFENDVTEESDDNMSSRPHITGATEPVSFSKRAIQPTTSSKRHSLVFEGQIDDHERDLSTVTRDPFKEAFGRDSFFDLYDEVSPKGTVDGNTKSPGNSSADYSGDGSVAQGMSGVNTADVAEKVRVRKWLKGLGLGHLYSNFAASGLLSLSSIEFLDYQDLALLGVPKDDCEKVLKAIQVYSSTTTELAHVVKGPLNPGSAMVASSSEDTVAALTRAIEQGKFDNVFTIWDDCVVPTQRSATKAISDDATRVYFDLRVYAATADSVPSGGQDKRAYLRDFKVFLATEAASELLSREPSLLVLAGLPFVTDSASHPELQKVHSEVWRSNVRTNATKLLRRMFLHPQHKDASSDLLASSAASSANREALISATEDPRSNAAGSAPSVAFLEAIEKLKCMEEAVVPPLASAEESPAVKAVKAISLFRKGRAAAKTAAKTSPIVQTNESEIVSPPVDPFSSIDGGGVIAPPAPIPGRNLRGPSVSTSFEPTSFGGGDPFGLPESPKRTSSPRPHLDSSDAGGLDELDGEDDSDDSVNSDDSTNDGRDNSGDDTHAKYPTAAMTAAGRTSEESGQAAKNPFDSDSDDDDDEGGG